MLHRRSSNVLARSARLALAAAATAGALLVLPSAASAAACDVGVVDKTWEGDVSSNWFNGNNWGPTAGVPTASASHDVCIPASTPNPPVLDNASAVASARSIESFQPIAVTGSSTTLTISGTAGHASTLHDDLVFSTGTNQTLTNNGSLTIEGDLDWGANATTINGSGTTTIAAGGTLTAAGDDTSRFLDAQTLRIDGTATFDGATAPSGFFTYVGNGAVIEVRSGGTLDLQDDQVIADNGGTKLLRVLAGGNLTRSGTGTSEIQIPVDNDATSSVSAQAGTLKLSGGSGVQTSTGQFNAATGATLDFSGGTHATSGSTFTGDGTVRVSGGQLSTAGTSSVAAQTTLDLTNSSILANAGTMTVNGGLLWNNQSAINGAGTTTIAVGGTLTASGDGTYRTMDAQTLRIDGAATFDGAPAPDYIATYLGTGAVLEVRSGGTLTLADNQIIGFNGGADPLVHVLAGGNLVRSGTDTSDIQIAFDNDATSSVSVQAGTLALSGGSGTHTSTGQFNAATGATLDFACCGTHNTSGSTFTGDGTIRASSSLVNTSGATSVAAATTFELTNATLVNTGTMTVNGSLLWNNQSAIAGAGTTTIAVGGTLTASGADTYRTMDVQTLQIDGAATFEAGGTSFATYLGQGADLEVRSGGTLTLQDAQLIGYNGGTDPLVHVLAGGNLVRSGTGTADIQIPFDNDATSSVSVQAGTLALSGGSGTHTSTGQFNAATGATIDFTNFSTQQLGAGASLTGDGLVRVSNSTLSTAGATSVAAATTLELTNATLNHASGANMTVNGALEWGEGSTLAGAGTTTIASAATLTNDNGDQRYLDTGTLRIDGTATLTSDQDGSFGDDTWTSNGADIDIGSGGTLDLVRSQDIVHSGAGATHSLHVLPGGTLTKSSGPGASRINGNFDNDGTVDVGAGELRLDVDGSPATFANYNQTTDVLSGGSYVVRNGAFFSFPGADVKTNGAEITLDGPGSTFTDIPGSDAFPNLNSNNASGKLVLRNDRNFTRTGGFGNSGTISLDDETNFTTTTAYNQTATGRFETDIAGTVAGTSFGRLHAGTTASLNGTLDVDVSAYPPASGDQIDVLTATTSRSGTFATVVGDGFTVNYLPDRVRITPPTLSINDVTKVEGNSGASNATFTVTLSSPSPGTVTVDYQTSNGTAGPADYTTTSGTLSFTPGQTSKPINVPVKGDLIDEVNETFNLTLSNPALADITDAGGVGTITDNDPPPAVSITDESSEEGGAEHSFDVTLSHPSSRQVKVDYQVDDGTATAPGDYVDESGQVIFSAGQTTKQVTVASSEDALDEADETFAVNLSNPVLSTIADATGTGTITDDDPTPTLSINDNNQVEGNPHQFTVTLSAASGQQVTVDYDTQDGTAVAPGDYAATSGQLIFAPGDTTEQINVAAAQDPTDEAIEDFTVELSNPVAATILDGSGSGTIQDNDPFPTVSVLDSPNRQEGAAQHRFDVVLSAPSEQQTRVDFTTQDGTATAPSDYPARSGRLVFAPGVTLRVVRIQSVEDLVAEPNETFTFEISDPLRLNIGDASGLGRIINDD